MQYMSGEVPGGEFRVYPHRHDSGHVRHQPAGGRGVEAEVHEGIGEVGILICATWNSGVDLS